MEERIVKMGAAPGVAAFEAKNGKGLPVVLVRFMCKMFGKANVAEHERTINSLKGMINRYQEAIVGQALLMSCAMEWDYEACED